MKKVLLIITLLFFSSLQLQSQTTVLEALLTTYVDDQGNVDYKGLRKNQAILDVYLNDLDKTIPGKNWSSDKAKSFWMNAYNAYAIKLILESYPLRKMTDIKRNGKNAWLIPIAKIGGATYTLDYIEHKILRRWHDDPRIHVGINAASKSGPKFVNFVFTEKNVNSKLTLLMKNFINDPNKNKITADKIEVSKMFEWYREDFTYKTTLIEYINKYSKVKVKKDATVVYTDYDWSLNDKI